jgi:glycerol-3-phosphate acyltransferase PlsY
MDTPVAFGYIIIFILAFLAGSIPSGVMVTRAFSKEDIRQKGSGNIGATNVARVAGMRLGLFTLALDLTKGALPVYLAGQFSAGPASTAAMTVAALAAVGGHMYPVYTLFRGGGKGVATAAGCFLVISPWACLAAVVLFILTVCLFRRVSAGSLAAALALPPAVWLFTSDGVFFVGALVVGLFVVARHRANIIRLIRGQEPPFFGKRDK